MPLKILWLRVGKKFLTTVLCGYLPVLKEYYNSSNCKTCFNWYQAFYQTHQISFAYSQVKKFICVYKLCHNRKKKETRDDYI